MDPKPGSVRETLAQAAGFSNVSEQELHELNKKIDASNNAAQSSSSGGVGGSIGAVCFAVIILFFAITFAAYLEVHPLIIQFFSVLIATYALLIQIDLVNDYSTRFDLTELCNPKSYATKFAVFVGVYLASAWVFYYTDTGFTAMLIGLFLLGMVGLIIEIILWAKLSSDDVPRPQKVEKFHSMTDYIKSKNDSAIKMSKKYR